MKVLVVDDEDLVRRSLVRALQSLGHHVLQAEDGRKGLGLWLSEHPDVVFLDVIMPRLTGPQVLQEMGDKSTAKVIMMSAFSGKDNSEVIRSESIDKFIAKPFEDIFAVARLAEEVCGGCGE